MCYVCAMSDDSDDDFSAPAIDENASAILPVQAAGDAVQREHVTHIEQA